MILLLEVLISSVLYKLSYEYRQTIHGINEKLKTFIGEYIIRKKVSVAILFIILIIFALEYYFSLYVIYVQQQNYPIPPGLFLIPLLIYPFIKLKEGAEILYKELISELRGFKPSSISRTIISTTSIILLSHFILVVLYQFFLMLHLGTLTLEESKPNNAINIIFETTLTMLGSIQHTSTGWIVLLDILTVLTGKFFEIFVLGILISKSVKLFKNSKNQ